MKFFPWLRGLCCGKTQHGKTYFIRKAILRQVRNYVVYNTKAEGKYREFGVNVSSVEQLRRVILEGATRVVYIPHDLSKEHFDEVCRVLWETSQNFLFVVEEVQTYGAAGYCTPWFKRMITQGEERGIGILATTQSPVNAPWDFKDNTSYMILFRLEQKPAEDAVRVKKEWERYVGLLQGLEVGEFYLYDGKKDEPITRHRPI